jgi:hypothetical protein
MTDTQTKKNEKAIFLSCFRNLTLSIIGVIIIMVAAKFSLDLIDLHLNFFKETIIPYVIGLTVLLIFTLLLLFCVLKKLPDESLELCGKIMVSLMVLMPFTGICIACIIIVNMTYKERNFDCYTASSNIEYCTPKSAEDRLK